MSGLEIATETYRRLLRLSFSDPFRIRNQGLYAALVDAISNELSMPPETVQTSFEARGNGVDSAQRYGSGTGEAAHGIENTKGSGAAGQD